MFGSPHFLYALVLVPLGAWWAVRYWRWRQAATQQFDSHAPNRHFQPLDKAKWGATQALVLVALALLVAAWADPKYGTRRRSTTQRSSDVLVALDLSRSMLADDVKPNRLALARIFAQKLTKSLPDNRIGLVFFAGEVSLQLPLTTDLGSVEALLGQADPSLLLVQGTDLGQTIRRARKFFDPESETGRALILITDCEDHFEDVPDEAREAYADDGIVLCTVGVGTAEGGNIPNGDGPLLDAEGNVVTTRLNESALREVAQAGGGAATLVTDGDAAIRQLRQVVDQLHKRDLVRGTDERDSVYQWLLLSAIFLLLLYFFLSKK
jgi:Ca-activated chloride channel homolog